MIPLKASHLVLASALALLVSCGAQSSRTSTADAPEDIDRDNTRELNQRSRSSISDLFTRPQTENTVGVNKYLWSASLEVLNFLPVQSVDPFTGVIVTGYGTPPNGGRAYRATILIDDPALDARSLNVALQSRSGAVSPNTVRAVEDAILTRARQLRSADNRL